MPAKMHADELDIDVHLIRSLLMSQFPQWAGLPLKFITPVGTDNAMFRLGNDLAIRLPRTARAAGNLEKECRWLPQLASQLTLPIPAPIERGEPQAGYPLPWEICHLLPGKNLSVTHLDDLQQAAIDMARFVTSLQQVDATDGPAASRGRPLSDRDVETRQAIAQLDGEIDTGLARWFWAAVLALPQWTGPPKWIHGDLHPGNVLVEDKRISAVIDFGACGVGDPACDLMFAWTVLDKQSRGTFRSIVNTGEATWLRGRGWAFTMGIVAYPYYKASNPVFAAVAKRAMDEALSEFTGV